jgi:hypothetical protein
MEQSDSTVLRFTTVGKFLTFLSASWSATTLLLLGSMVTVGVVQATYRALQDASVPTPNGADIVGQLTASVGIGSLVMVAVGTASGRFLLRAIPPHLDGANRVRSATVALLVCAGFVTFVGFDVLLLVLQASGSDESRPVSDAVPLVGKYIALSVIPALFWTISAVGTVVHRYRHPRTFIAQPYVLFLRRFSTFSDRAVIALVLRQAPSGIPVVFLTPTMSRPADWDPFIVGIAGLKLRHPLRSAPIVLRARDADWQAAATELIRGAQIIIVDASEDSGALRNEAAMIGSADRWSNTVCLRNLSSTVTDTVPVDAFSRARHIGYTKSWIRAIPKLIIAVPFTLFSAVFLSVPLVLAFNSGFAMLTILAAASIAYSVFWRPAIDRSAKIALKRALRTGASTVTPNNRSKLFHR